MRKIGEFKILNHRRRDFTVAKSGTISRHLKGIYDTDWLIPMTEYYVTVKHPNESFTRTFVLTEREFINTIQTISNI